MINEEIANALRTISRRDDAVDFCEKMKNGCKDKDQKQGWVLAEFLAANPSAVEPDGWPMSFKRRHYGYQWNEQNCFAQLEKLLDAGVAWLFYRSHLGYFDTQASPPPFLLHQVEVAELRHRAGAPDEEFMKYGMIDQRLRRKKWEAGIGAK